MSVSPPRKPIWILILLGIGVAIIVIGGLQGVERLKPTASEVEAIRIGMSADEVVAALGVMYDEYDPGDHAGVDRVLKGRSLAVAPTGVHRYDLRGSREVAWIVYGDGDRVLDVWIAEAVGD